MTDEEKVPWFKDLGDLTAYIEEQVGGQHDYNTVPDAIANAAVAAYNYVAGTLGASGFQASYADLQFLKKVRHLDCPFAIVKGEDMLFPQYDGPAAKAAEYEVEWQDWAREEAKKKIAKIEAEGREGSYVDDDGETVTYTKVHPNVWDHWQALANG